MNDQSYKILLKQLGIEIKALRHSAGFSQESLALAADVDRTYVSQLERGVANPSLMILHRLSRVLGKELQIAFEDSKLNLDSLD